MIDFFQKKILIVVAHPDDELLGLGATIHHLSQNYNSDIRVIILGEGITSRGSKQNKEIWKDTLDQHHKCIYKAQKLLKYQSVRLYDFPDNRFDSIDLLEIIKVVEQEKANFNPDIIFTHHGGDLNIDHRITFQAVITASRPIISDNLHTIISFETPSSTEWQSITEPFLFKPNMFFEVTYDDIKAKMLAMESYKFELRDYPHPRSAKSLEIIAQRYGLVINSHYAEAFQIVRTINYIKSSNQS